MLNEIALFEAQRCIEGKMYLSHSLDYALEHIGRIWTFIDNMANNNNGDQQTTPSDARESIIEIEKRFLKLASIQTVLSVAAVFTGAIALYAALTESHAVRKQTAASVWPYIQTTINDSSTQDSAYITISLSNVGVGPAKIQGVLLQYKGEYIASWQSFVELFDAKAELGVTYGKSDVQDRVLAPQESLTIFNTDESNLAHGIQDALYQGDLAISYCYCSIFEDCWLKPFPGSGGEQTTHTVEECPTADNSSFL